MDSRAFGGIAAVGVIERQRLETKNRIALILLDSNFEIALKEYLVHRPDLFPPKEFDDTRIKEIFKRRHEVIRVVATKAPLSKEILDKAAHYYVLRNKLVHERATVDITNSDIANYQATIQEVLRILFGVRFPG